MSKMITCVSNKNPIAPSPFRERVGVRVDYLKGDINAILP
jgi:hypothetical protein